MDKKKLVFVLGAGASHEVEMPIGEGFKESIRTCLRFGNDGWNQVDGDKVVYGALRAIVEETNGEEERNVKYRSLMKACREIRSALPQAPSIDSYVESRIDSPSVAECAKIAICSTIARAEGASRLASGVSENFDFSRMRDTWLDEMFKALFAGRPLDGAMERARQIGFVSFNYDRTLERYLEMALGNYYPHSPSRVRELLDSIEIYHPYGMIGPLPRAGLGGLPFGEAPGSSGLLEASKLIKTFSEGVDERGDIGKIRNLVSGAHGLVFLGFAFHEQNVELLFPGHHEPFLGVPKILASGFGISEYNKKHIESGFVGKFGASLDIRIEPLVCNVLVRSYSRMVSFA